MLWTNYESHDRTGNYVAFDYSYNILQSCEKDAILFTNGDNDTFPLWFLQYVHNIRPDVRVVNLSLLNTNWYIHQLKNDEPIIDIKMSAQSIENIQPQPWKTSTVTIPVNRAKYDEYYAMVVRVDSTVRYEDKPEMRFEVKPTLYSQALRVQDLMILKILQDNQFKRPVYFAVTVSPQNKIGLDPYMRMDGLAFRVMPVKVDRRFVDPDIMWTTLDKKFKYRNLDNPDVYYNDNIISLLQNYRSAFFQLAQFYLYKKDNEKALVVLDRMSEAIPEDVIAPNDIRIAEAIGYMYSQAGKPEEMDKRYLASLNNHGAAMTPKQKLEFAGYFNYRNKTELAESLALSIIAEDPDQGEAYYWLGRFYNSHNRRDEAIKILEEFLEQNPNDTRARLDLDVMKRARARIDTSSAASSTGEGQ